MDHQPGRQVDLLGNQRDVCPLADGVHLFALKAEAVEHADACLTDDGDIPRAARALMAQRSSLRAGDLQCGVDAPLRPHMLEIVTMAPLLREIMPGASARMR